MISSIFYGKQNQTQIQIIENRIRRHQQLSAQKSEEIAIVIESKLMISNTRSSHHTGKYSCAAVIDSELGIKRIPVTTNRVDIKIISRENLDNSEKSKTSTTGNYESENLGLSMLPYCNEVIVQTYRGVYKWPQTVANSKLSQKCVSGRTTVNDTTSFECGDDGKWSDNVDVQNCLFESNLTRYLDFIDQSNFFIILN